MKETIAAIATPWGRGGVGIIRVSGPAVLEIAKKLLGKVPEPRYANFSSFFNQTGQVIDQGLVLYFPNPHSFTGEDVLELQGHGGPVVMDNLLTRVLELGARLAKPGEFSERAFLNNKLDLVQAEAIADLINAGSHQAAQAALRSLQGEFSKKINTLVDQLISLRVYIEASIDFAEEAIEFLEKEHIAAQLKKICEHLEIIEKTAKQGVLLKEGLTIVIAGLPNAGKSSLLNALSGRESAIVTEIPGTTRDVLHEWIQIDGVPLHIVDTAGLRDSHDPVEQEGVRRAKEEMDKADVIIWVSEANAVPSTITLPTEKLTSRLAAGNIHIIYLLNKIDLRHEKPIREEKEGMTTLSLSVKTGEGLEGLRETLKKIAGYSVGSEGNFSARRRHLVALACAKSAIKEGLKQYETMRAPELLAEDLRQAQHALEEITGKFTTEDLLGKIFSEFCVGK